MWVAAILCTIGLLLTASRGALLGAGAAALVLVVLLGPSVVGRRSSVIIAAIGVLALLAGLVFALRGGGSGAVRLLLWQEAAQYIVVHPLGIGLDQFYQYHNPAFGRSLIAPELRGTSEEFAAHPHNLILDTWLRLGPLGLVAFGWLIVRAVRRCLAQPTDPVFVGVLAALAAALTHGLLDNFYFVPDLAFCFWLLVAVSGRDDKLTG